jgi:hypothetical protein
MVDAGVDARHLRLVRWTLPSSVRAGLNQPSARIPSGCGLRCYGADAAASAPSNRTCSPSRASRSVPTWRACCCSGCRTPSPTSADHRARGRGRGMACGVTVSQNPRRGRAVAKSVRCATWRFHWCAPAVLQNRTLEVRGSIPLAPPENERSRSDARPFGVSAWRGMTAERLRNGRPTSPGGLVRGPDTAVHYDRPRRSAPALAEPGAAYACMGMRSSWCPSSRRAPPADTCR